MEKINQFFYLILSVSEWLWKYFFNVKTILSIDGDFCYDIYYEYLSSYLFTTKRYERIFVEYKSFRREFKILISHSTLNEVRRILNEVEKNKSFKIQDNENIVIVSITLGGIDVTNLFDDFVYYDTKVTINDLSLIYNFNLNEEIEMIYYKDDVKFKRNFIVGNELMTPIEKIN